MNFTKQLRTTPTKLVALIAVVLMVVLLAGVASANHGPGSIPYEGADTEGPQHAAFNIYSGDVPANPSSAGEQDFVTVSPAGENDWSNKIEVCDGEADMHVYVHNGAEVQSNGNNLDGDGVATGARLQVVIPDGHSGTRTVKARISADNTLTIEDGAKIVCDEHPIELTYIEGSAKVYRSFTGNLESMSDEIVSENGTPIGYKTNDGIVPGCWEYRQYYVLSVSVEEAEEPEPEMPVCEQLTVAKVDEEERTVSVNVDYTLNDADFRGVEIDFGDGTETEVVFEFPYEYTYAETGDYNISATVQTDLGPVTSDACEQAVTITEDRGDDDKDDEDEDEEVAEVPEELPDTGPASLVGLFTVTSVAGATVHRIVAARRRF